MTKSLVRPAAGFTPSAYDPRIHKVYMLFNPKKKHLHDDFIGIEPVPGQEILTEKGVRGTIKGKPHYSSFLGWTCTFKAV